MQPLTPRDRVILIFEEQHRVHSGAKDAAIRDTFGWRATRYYQHLNRIIDEPAAIPEFPLLVRSLRAARARRTADRRANRFRGVNVG